MLFRKKGSGFMIFGGSTIIDKVTVESNERTGGFFSEFDKVNITNSNFGMNFFTDRFSNGGGLVASEGKYMSLVNVNFYNNTSQYVSQYFLNKCKSLCEAI